MVQGALSEEDGPTHYPKIQQRLQWWSITWQQTRSKWPNVKVKKHGAGAIECKWLWYLWGIPSEDCRNWNEVLLKTPGLSEGDMDNGVNNE